MEKQSATGLYSAVKSVMHAIRTEHNNAQPDAAHQMIQITMPWTSRRCSELELVYGKPLVRTLKENAHLADLELTEDKQAKLSTLGERYTSWGASRVWWIYEWRLACFSSVLGDTGDRNEVSEQWYDEMPFEPWVDSPLFQWLRDTFLPMFVNSAAEYPESEEDHESNVALLYEPETNQSPLPRAPAPQKAVLFCPLPGQVLHLKWWLTKFFGDDLDICYMYAEMGNNELTEMQLKFDDLPHPSVLVTTAKVSGTSRNLTPAKYAVITPKFLVLSEQRHLSEQAYGARWRRAIRW